MRRSLAIAVAIASALLLVAPAGADSLDDAKSAGQVGEQSDGYLGLVPGAPASARALVDRINAERAEKYAEIAKKRDTTPAAVAALAGKKLIERTPSGQWYRDPSGQWKQR
jgi:uncharacterized protein YdbL (DUF1318 family)